LQSEAIPILVAHLGAVQLHLGLEGAVVVPVGIGRAAGIAELLRVGVAQEEAGGVGRGDELLQGRAIQHAAITDEEGLADGRRQAGEVSAHAVGRIGEIEAVGRAGGQIVGKEDADQEHGAAGHIALRAVGNGVRERGVAVAVNDAGNAGVGGGRGDVGGAAAGANTGGAIRRHVDVIDAAEGHQAGHIGEGEHIEAAGAEIQGRGQAAIEGADKAGGENIGLGVHRDGEIGRAGQFAAHRTPADIAAAVIEVDEAGIDALDILDPAALAQPFHFLRSVEQSLQLVCTGATVGAHAQHVGRVRVDGYGLQDGILAVAGRRDLRDEFEVAQAVIAQQGDMAEHAVVC